MVLQLIFLSVGTVAQAPEALTKETHLIVTSQPNFAFS